MELEETEHPSLMSPRSDDSVDDRRSPIPSYCSSSSSSSSSSSIYNPVVEPCGGDGGFGEDKHIDDRRESFWACSPNEIEATRRSRLEGEDRISDLDDELLVNILSLLPTEVAIRTGVLSKRWASLWTFVPVLDFNHARRSSEPLIQFAYFVYKTLVRHMCPKITDFRLSLHPYDSEDGFHLKSHLDLWIGFATAKYVEDVILSLYDEEISLEPNLTLPQRLFSCSFLKSLFISHLNIVPEGVVNWKYLHHLSIGYTILSEDDFGKVLSGSPVLELLDLHRCGGLNRLDLTCSTSLKTLVIRDFWEWEGFNDIIEENKWLEVIAPNLKEFHVSGSLEKKCRLVNALALVSVNLDVANLRDDLDIKDADEVCMLYYNESEGVLRGLLHGIGHVEDLTLGPWCYLVLVFSLLYPRVHLSPLSMCKRLTINILQNRELDGIWGMVRVLPHLETLVIQFIPPDITTKYYDEEFWSDMEYDEMNLWTSREKTSECLQLHLKTVKIVSCLKCDKRNILTLAQFFLEKAMVLEKVVVEKTIRDTCLSGKKCCYSLRRYKAKLAQVLELDGIECIFRALPQLETLIIQLIPPNIKTKFYDEEFLADMEFNGTNPWPTRVTTSECLQLHLKTVKIVSRLKCHKWDILTLAQFFLEKAMVLLEKVIVEKARTDTRYDWYNYSVKKCSYSSRRYKAELVEMLLGLPRSSPLAVVKFSE